MGHRAGLTPGELRVLLVFASCAPDLDVIGLYLGIPYLHSLGHRGASHALLTALAFGLGTAITLWLSSRRRPPQSSQTDRAPPHLATFGGLALLVAATMASHGLLDTLTDGGHGVALAWPLSGERWFAPIRPIAVSQITNIFTLYQAQVFGLEALLFGLPLLGVWLLGHLSGGRARRALGGLCLAAAAVTWIMRCQ